MYGMVWYGWLKDYKNYNGGTFHNQLQQINVYICVMETTRLDSVCIFQIHKHNYKPICVWRPVWGNNTGVLFSNWHL